MVGGSVCPGASATEEVGRACQEAEGVAGWVAVVAALAVAVAVWVVGVTAWVVGGGGSELRSHPGALDPPVVELFPPKPGEVVKCREKVIAQDTWHKDPKDAKEMYGTSKLEHVQS